MSPEVAVEMQGGKWKRYPAYRDSGVEWLGEVPEGWEFTRLKYALKEKLKYGANESAELDDTNLPRYIRITDFGDDGKLKDDTFKSLLFEVAKDYFLQHGDILFARSGATVGKTFQFKKYDGLACFAGYLIKATPDENIILSDFLYFLTKSNLYEKWKNNIFIQATIQNIGADKYGLLPIFLPNINEQRAIAAFLDHETGRIDTLIEKKGRQVELLQEKRAALISHAVTKGLDPNVKMKDSGVDWIGEAPEHWKTIRLKYAFILMRGFDLASDKFIDGCYPVRGSNGIIGYHDKYTTVGPSITVGRSGSVGEVHYIGSNFWAHNTSLYVKYFKQTCPKFSYYLLKTLDLKSLSAGSAVGTLNRNYIHDLPITIPTETKQFTIAAFLDRETGRIDTLTTKIQESISKVREYRTALISAAVTGKIDVREDFVS